MRVKLGVLSAILVVVVGLAACVWLRDGIPFISKWRGVKTVADRIEETKTVFDQEVVPALKAAGINGLPSRVALIFLKDQKKLELYAAEGEGPMHFVKSYPVRAASGKPGPKLREGDRQVPEGVYSIESLNPNSSYYLSLKVNYPNAADRRQGEADQRSNLGGDIMIHGSRVSIGCIAIGDEAIAEVFHLAAVTDYRKWKLLLAPTDFRTAAAPREIVEKQPWMNKVYLDLKNEMSKCPN